ncbi:nitroreductase/quinone reductase family protein [Streptacidiphilus albus]|uniref:nitroreductase/quinone reductase family protein n=1 Tax=Streptacidiphilus albus TaxID=105425 RepID=UPI000694E899|nr:nitroreductase/quinone reductase family protein [Streptacidiphilus albus]
MGDIVTGAGGPTAHGTATACRAGRRAWRRRWRRAWRRAWQRARQRTQRGLLTLHRAVYRATGGVVGAWYFGMPVLLLGTRGRRTGRTRVAGLVFARDGGRYVVGASDNGAPHHPGWYYNLMESGEGVVRYRRTVQRVRAAEVGAAECERARLWGLLLEVYPGFAEHQALAGRLIPVVVLTPELTPVLTPVLTPEPGPGSGPGSG